jgi:hypothetical protein
LALRRAVPMEATPKEGCSHPAENRACDGLYQALMLSSIEVTP